MEKLFVSRKQAVHQRDQSPKNLGAFEGVSYAKASRGSGGGRRTRARPDATARSAAARGGVRSGAVGPRARPRDVRTAPDLTPRGRRTDSARVENPSEPFQTGNFFNRDSSRCDATDARPRSRSGGATRASRSEDAGSRGVHDARRGRPSDEASRARWIASGRAAEAARHGSAFPLCAERPRSRANSGGRARRRPGAWGRATYLGPRERACVSARPRA